MKPLLDALGKGIKGLLSVFWFAIVVAAIASVFLLMYANGSPLLPFGCCTSELDSLGICPLLQANLQWIGLIAITSIIMCIIGGVLLIWQHLKPAQ